MQKLELRSSFLVIPNLKFSGGVSYTTSNEDASLDGATEVKHWTTERVIVDVEEFAEGKALKQRLERWLKADPDTKETICAATPMGYVCPMEKRAKFEAARDAIATEVASFNSTATASRIMFRPVCFEITGDNTEAVKVIRDQILESLNDLANSLKNRDYESVRQHLRDTKGLDTIFPENVGDVLGEAFDSCRRQAKEIAKEIREAEGQIELTAIKVNLSKVNLARTMFLELEPNGSDVELPKTQLRVVEA